MCDLSSPPCLSEVTVMCAPGTRGLEGALWHYFRELPPDMAPVLFLSDNQKVVIERGSNTFKVTELKKSETGI